ncbi:hypothetical protein NECAME_14634 [Necator americanus]|uniref:Uncharacterized protein n=1 Tax=Necator americanus TaxID=51031 RepID=W2SPK9_NECAM|nr:hypothetical protein NECAME_14634 [Necator americanus]ETN70637.1 hypothetical protein NECAME_14634 [Necator americanus]
MVGIFKSAYRNAIGEETHDIKTLKTLTAECTAVCNSRPLSHVTEEQSWYPLRPTDFLRSTAIIAAPRIKPAELLTSRTDVQENLIKLREYTSEMLDCFWKRWNSEYLLTLREQYKRSNKHPRLEEKSQPKLHDSFYMMTRFNVESGNSDKLQYPPTISNEQFKSALPTEKSSKGLATALAHWKYHHLILNNPPSLKQKIKGKKKQEKRLLLTR